MSHFTFAPEDYKRDIDVVENYIRQNALYLQRMTGRSYEDCRAFIERSIGEGGQFALKSPQTRFLLRTKNGDRKPTTTDFKRYLEVIQENELLVAPTLTTYLPVSKKRSLIGIYIGGNLKNRSAMKKRKFEEKMAGNKQASAFYDLLQSTFKIKNNSISGAHASPYQILYNKSSHSTLTSTCRTGTSYANANNEKFLMGNRHYWSAEITRSNILSVIDITDRKLFQKTMDEFNLHYPSAEEMMECIRRSTDLYWRIDSEMASLYELARNLEPLERAMFVYVGDLFHLAKHNPEFARQLLADFSTKATEPVDNPGEYIGQLNDDAKALVSLLCEDNVKGKQLADLMEDRPEDYAIVGATAKHLLATLDKYELLIKGMWATLNLPPSVYKVPSLYRRCAIVSDTDSTIFTNQYWTEWFVGKVDFSKESYAIGYVTTYLTSQIVVHFLAVMSANMGVATPQIHQLTMKSEFYFPTLALTSMAKHYYSYIKAQEGNVFSEWDTEIKGVSLKNSNWPGEVADQLKEYMQYLMDRVIEHGQLGYDEILTPVYEMEKAILTDVDNGGYRYLTTSQIKGPDSYVDGVNAGPYQHHTLWQEVFAPKYGEADPPPYQSVKVSVLLEKPSQLKAWIENMEDRDLAARLETWAKRVKKNGITTLRLPESILKVSGIPKEIVQVVDRRKLLFNTVSGFYLVLESMGLFMMEKSRMRFVSDFYTPGQGQLDKTA